MARKKKTTNKTERTQNIETSLVEEHKLATEVEAHLEDSQNFMSTLRGDWDDQEAMLLGDLKDSISTQRAKSQVFDPRLSSIVFERAARVMAQQHVGHAFAESKDDLGKNKLADLLLDFYTRKATEGYPMLVKLRLLDLYSLVYGSFFCLVPWRVDPSRDYIGPELNLIPIRDVFPQPSVMFGDAEWVQVRTWTSLEWLKSQDPKVWRNVDELERELKGTGGDTKGGDADDTSHVERTYTPEMDAGDVAFPRVGLITEYRRDKWITFSRRDISRKGSKTRILRVVENPYAEGKLPVVKKDAFPLIDRVIGLGEFERGMTLQKAINSLINLYLDGVKYSIFPPVQINPNAAGLVKSSIKWNPAAKWFVGRPNQDIQLMQMSPQGANTFASTYGFMVSALNSMAGTTSLNEGDEVKSTVGKTPQAIQYLRARESARDEWDRFMMEQSIKEIYQRWIDLIVDKMEKPVVMRVYGAEIADIAEKYPDVAEVFESGEQGRVTVSKDKLGTKYDYRVEVGSTMRPNPDREAIVARELLDLLRPDQNPQLIQRVEAAGKQINYAELVSRVLASTGLKDWDKIIVDAETQPAGVAPPGQVAGGGAAPVQPQPQPQFNDPDVRQVASQILGGIGSIPPQ